MTQGTVLKIRLYREDGGWMMQSNDPETKRLFGTDTLPTPFLASVPFSQVYDVIATLNPGAAIDVWHGPVVGGIKG